MSVTLNTELAADLSSTLEPPRPSNTGEENSGTSALWIARAAIVGFAAALAWRTWGHWGDFQVDNGRELYVPAEILKGKLLFRDLWYMYGPLAPYLKAFLFWIFGVKLNVLFGFGLAMAIGSALIMFDITRRFGLGITGSLVPSVFFLIESFYPTIRNFVFPYSYASSLAAFLGIACLYFVLRHAVDGRTSDLVYASLLTGLVILTKQEFGVSCLALVGFEIAAGYWSRRSSGEFWRNVGIFSAGLLPAVAGYGWFVWKTSARLIFFENWISTPGTYFMRTFGKITIPAQGLRFIPQELLICNEFTALGIAVWALLAILTVAAIKKLELDSRWSIAVTAVVVLFPLWASAIVFRIMYPWGYVLQPKPWTDVLLPTTDAIVPHGLFFLALLFTGYAIWNLIREPRNQMAVLEGALGIYGLLVGLRVMMKLRPTIFDGTVFFNGPVFIVFTILLYRILRWACRSLDERRARTALVSMLAVESISLVLLLFPRPAMLPAKFTSDVGSFYTKPDVAVLFPQIVSFMKSHTVNGKDILVVPEPPSLYTYAGMDAPSRMYALVPGYIGPDQEQDYINQLKDSQVRYVLITNRIVMEYHVPGFNLGGYNVPVYNWIKSNFVQVGQFGPQPDAAFPPFTVWIYERRDLVSAGTPAD
jgi:hypothetical protein